MLIIQSYYSFINEQLLVSETMAEELNLFRIVLEEVALFLEREWPSITSHWCHNGARPLTFWGILSAVSEVKLGILKKDTEQTSITASTKVKQSLMEWKWVFWCSHAKKLKQISWSLSSNFRTCKCTTEIKMVVMLYIMQYKILMSLKRKK